MEKTITITLAFSDHSNTYNDPSLTKEQADAWVKRTDAVGRKLISKLVAAEYPDYEIEIEDNSGALTNRIDIHDGRGMITTSVIPGPECDTELRELKRDEERVEMLVDQAWQTATEMTDDELDAQLAETLA